MDLRTRASTIGDWTIVSLFSELDVASAPALREELIDRVNAGATHLVLDLEGLDFLDSTGLGTIISALKRTRTKGGELRLVCTRSHIRRLFEITGLDRALPLHATVDAATDR